MSRPWGLADIPQLDDDIAVVTGANRGLGLEISAALAAAGATVVMACRDAARAEAALAEVRRRAPAAKVEFMPLDLGKLASVRRFAADFTRRHRRLDILCNNASAILVPQGRTQDGFETHIGTNHLGPFALTGLLVGQLLAAPAGRVVNTSSLAHRMTAGLDPDDLNIERGTYKDMDAYGRSKLAALLFTFELARRAQQAQLPLIALAAHPGYTATNLNLGSFIIRLSTRLFAQAPAQGALPALFAATAPQVSNGGYYGPSGFKELKGPPVAVDCRPEARDPVLARKLWEASERLTGVHWL